MGPVSREVALDLLRSRPGIFVHLSPDGARWAPVRGPDVQSMVGAEASGDRRVREGEEAQRVLLELDRYRELKPHLLFGVPAGSDIRGYRAGFLGIAKRFHPGRLPRDVAPALLKAHMAVYQYLTEVMAELERNGVPAPAPAAPPPRPSASAAAPPPRAEAKAAPLWSLEVLKLKQLPHALEGAVEVTPQTAIIFSLHRLVNLTTTSCFFPCMPTLPLGTRLDLTFRFVEAKRDVKSRGAVSLESTLLDEKQHLRGFGVRLDGLTVEDKGFMLREVRRLQAPSR